jgi:hypothetical protein
MVGVWICSGTVPALIYYGLKLLSPSIFLAASLLNCSVVSPGHGQLLDHREFRGDRPHGHRGGTGHTPLPCAPGR